MNKGEEEGERKKGGGWKERDTLQGRELTERNGSFIFGQENCFPWKDEGNFTFICETTG